MSKKNKNDIEYTYEERQETPFARITQAGEDKKSYQPKNTWQLDLSDFLEAIDPLDYFITSGEATLKARKLERDLFQYAGKARKLVNALKKIKGDNVYLETSWFEGRLILKAKNPRKNHEDKIKALEQNFMYGEKQNDPKPST